MVQAGSRSVSDLYSVCHPFHRSPCVFVEAISNGADMHRREKKGDSMHNVAIVDPAALQSVLAEVLSQKGSQVAAAEHLGIQQPTFSRLINGLTDFVAYANYDSMARALGGRPSRYRRNRVVLEFVADLPESPKKTALESERGASRARQARAAGELPPESDIAETGPESAAARAKREADALTASNLLERFESSFLSADAQFVWTTYDEWLRVEVSRLKQVSEPVFRELWADDTSRAILAAFLRDIERDEDLPQEEDRRAWLALYRMVEPLAAFEPTWAVERPWRELQEKGDLKSYLQAAAKREKIVLNRERDLDRVTKCQPPIGYWEAMALDAARDHFFDENPSATMEEWDSLIAKSQKEDGG